MNFPALLTFLSDLAANNNKAWFEENRATYQRLRAEWMDFIQKVIDGIAQFDPTVAVVSPKDALFRVNRDVRFSKDKSPYKTTFSAAICPQVWKAHAAISSSAWWTMPPTFSKTSER